MGFNSAFTGLMISEYFSKIGRENLSLMKNLTMITVTLHEDLCTL